jgi:4-hydroxy-2-oxoheptanedioate aldolase
MRQNLLRERLGRGRCAIGIYPGVVSAELVEFCGLLGFDWVFIDGEHGGVDVPTCSTLIRAADRVGIGSLVRVPSADPSVILGYLETGALAITVPHITNSDQARAAVAAGRYPPSGTRGAGSTTPAANYGLTQTAAEYFAQANEQVWILPQIEDAEAVKNIREILTVPGVEGIVVGPGDLAASMGLPGQPGHPEVMAAVHNVIAEARSARKHVGTVAGSPAAINALIAKGADFMMCSALALLADAGRRLLHEIKTGTDR